MKQLSHRFKSSIVEVFTNENGKSYENMTIKELVKTFQEELNKDKEEQENKEKLVIDKYTGVYLKKIDNDALFGATLEV